MGVQKEAIDAYQKLLERMEAYKKIVEKSGDQEKRLYSEILKEN